MTETIYTILIILAWLGLFAAALANHLAWRRRLLRIRKHWMEAISSQRKDYEKQLVTQSMEYNKRIRSLAEQRLPLLRGQIPSHRPLRRRPT